MLICLVLCAAAVLPTAFSNNEMIHRGIEDYNNFMPHNTLTGTGLSPLQQFGDDSKEIQGMIGSTADFLKRLSKLRNIAILKSIEGDHLFRRYAGLDTIDAGNLLKTDRGLRHLDAIGGGHLLKRSDDSLRQWAPFIDDIRLKTARGLDSIDGRNLLKRDPGLRPLDSIGGGHLLKRSDDNLKLWVPLIDILPKTAEGLESIDGRNLLKRDHGLRHLDSIGGGHLLKRSDGLSQRDPTGGDHLLKRDVLDSIGGGNLL